MVMLMPRSCSPLHLFTGANGLSAEIKNWYLFKETLEDAVHINSKLTDSEKASYLLGCLRGNALKILQGSHRSEKMNKTEFDSSYFRKVISKSKMTESIPTLNELLTEATNKFYDEFDYYPNLAFCAPGTFTIMGEYMELAGGLIVQGALPLLTLVLGRGHDCFKCRIVTSSKEIAEPNRVLFPAASCTPFKKGFPRWANFLKGVMNMFLHKNKSGFDALIHSSVPILHGFGSSAALETSFYSLVESLCHSKISTKNGVKAKKCKNADEKFGGSKYGSINNYTTFFAENTNAVVIDSWTFKVNSFSFRDPNILFLLILPSSDLVRYPENLIRTRETELKLAARLLNLNHIKDAEECHIEALASMEEPTGEEVIAILREFESDESYISDFVEEFFTVPNVGEAADVKDPEFVGESVDFMTSFEDAQESDGGKILYGESFTEFKYGTVCDENICLGWLSNLSVSSDSSVMSKLVRRVRYIVTENSRIRSLIKYISELDYVSAGMELTRSHLSLKVDFEVSSVMIDRLVQFTVQMENGVYGSKMMRNGGTLTLLHRNCASEVIKSIKENFGEDFRFHLIFPGRGVRKVNAIPLSVPKSILSDAYPTIKELLKKAVDNFEATYQRFPTHGCVAPSSVKILGDHSDYNQTYTLPMALNMATIVVGALNGSGKIRVATTTKFIHQPQKVMFPIPSVESLKPGQVKWANYVKGVVRYFKGSVPGFDCLIESSIPPGSRISSSTSLQVALYGFLEELTGQRTDNVREKAYRCMKAEHDFTYSVCGIDDFIVSLKGSENRMILVDCKKTTFSYLPAFDPSFVFLLVYVSSFYKPSKCLLYMRLEQCYDVARALGLTSLRCVQEKDLEGLQNVNETAIKRARHIITEEKRVLASAEALRNFDAEKFGRLMVESHISLRDHFEVSCRELDTLVERSMEVDGVLGARMTGSEYGGSIICLVKRWAVDDLIEYIRYTCQGNFNFYVLTPSGGSEILDVKGYLDTLPGPRRTFERIFEI